MAKVIAIEGLDGSGKTTALKFVVEQLRNQGFKVLETREVGSPLVKVAQSLREIILNPNSEMSGMGMELVFAAMRIENQRVYEEMGKDYDFIVSDRGFFSHLAYTDHNVSTDFVKDLYLKFMTKYTKNEDYVIYLSVDPDLALNRRIKRGEVLDAIELKGVEYQKKVGKSFMKYFKKFASAQPILKIDANQELEKVQTALLNAMSLITTDHKARGN